MTATGVAGADAAVDTIDGEGVVTFTGRRGPLASLIVKNTLLNIVTGGIYRFWARTDIRRYFWRALAIGDDDLEYTGRGLELFLGFLIVLAVLVPLVVAISLAGLVLPHDGTGPVPLINLLYIVVIVWLIAYASYRARRYRLSRTLWRGIRGGQDGSAVRFAFLSFVYLILTILSLGIARPWTRVALQRYRMTHTLFGNERFRLPGAAAL